MGARQSKRSVDITTTPKKGDGEVLAEGEGKLEKIGDADVKVATNGSVPHNDLELGVSTRVILSTNLSCVEFQNLKIVIGS